MTEKKKDGLEVAADLAATEQGQGFYGIEVDQTPNENYTVAGVTAHKPTPETDAKAKATATVSDV